MAYRPDLLGMAYHGGSRAAQNVFVMASEDDAATSSAAGYIADGYRKGMKVGDLVQFSQVTLAADGTIETIVARADLHVSDVDAADNNAITLA